MDGDNVLGKIVDEIVVAFFIIMAVFVFMYVFRISEESYAKSITKKFADRCRDTGVIDPQKYEKYVQTIYLLGNGMSVQLEHDRAIAFYRDGEPELDTENTYTNQILAAMYPDANSASKQYRMKNGDSFYIKLTENQSRTFVGRVLEALFIVKQPQIVLTTAGGDVGQNAY